MQRVPEKEKKKLGFFQFLIDEIRQKPKRW